MMKKQISTSLTNLSSSPSNLPAASAGEYPQHGDAMGGEKPEGGEGKKEAVQGRAVLRSQSAR